MRNERDYYAYDDRREIEPSPRKASGTFISGRAERPVPEGVEIQKGHQRTHDVMRARVEGHLHELRLAGYLSDKEYDARAKAVAASVVEDDLSLLISDLPPLPLSESEKEKRAREKAEKKAKRKTPAWLWKKQPGFRAACHIGIFFLAVMTIVVSSVILSSWPKGGPPLATLLVFIPLIVAGVFTIIANFCWVGEHYDLW
jgi:hypothetical protein